MVAVPIERPATGWTPATPGPKDVYLSHLPFLADLTPRVAAQAVVASPANLLRGLFFQEPDAPWPSFASIFSSPIHVALHFPQST